MRNRPSLDLQIGLAIFIPIALLVGGIKLLGWLSAQTVPSKVGRFSPAAQLSAVPAPTLPSQSLPTWSVVEVVSGDRLRVIRPQARQPQLVQLACIAIVPENNNAQYAGDRLRRLVTEVNNQIQVDVVDVGPDGQIFVDVWFANTTPPKLAQVELARMGYATLSANGEQCPNQQAIAAAVETRQQRRQPNLIRF